MISPKCPYCDIPILEFDNIERWNEGIKTQRAVWLGECPKCRARFSWIVNYTATDFSNFQEF